ncbi:transcriptional regulator [Pseudomonas putida]|uniref:Transcriptional regulator n=1 Tax=Pseudomonas putida TaxID=303 RepID=A0A2Z4RUN4_PSEPU|nr:transcriptional regulator [Pseudomonas putida]AWY44445.1 transcriptional regulator [Pseudomonas putida]
MTMSVMERRILLESILEELANDTLSIHQAVRRLRVEVTGLNQAKFARMCKISVRSLVQMEQGEGNQTLKSLNKVFCLFGMRVGVLKLRRDS